MQKRRAKAIAGVVAAGVAGWGAAGAATAAPPIGSATVAPQTMINGVVTNVNGEKIAGATAAYVVISEVNQYQPITAASATTDAEGRFRMDTPPHNGGKEGKAAYLLVAAPGYGVARAELTAPAPLKITLAPAGELRIPVIDVDGNPLAGTRLFARVIQQGRQNFYQPPAEMTLSSVSGADGVCVLRGLPTDSFVLAEIQDERFAHLSYEAARFATAGAGASLTTKPLKAFAGAVVTGRVMNGVTGKPAAGIRVSAQGIKNGWGSALTDADGKYRLTRLSEDVYNIALDLKDKAEWTARAQEQVALKAGGELAGKDFRLIKGAILAGRVVGADGKPIAGMAVGVYGPAHPQSTAWVQGTETDAEGRYNLRVPGGKQYLYLMVSEAPDGYELPVNKNLNVTVEDGKTLTTNWKLPVGKKSSPIRVTVTGADGKPVADADVSAAPIGDSFAFEGLAPGKTDAKGVFLLEKQRRALRVRARRGDSATLAAVVAAPGESVALRLTDKALVSIGGQVNDAEGMALSGAKVSLTRWANGYGTSSEETVTDAQGKFHLTGLWPDDRYSLTAQADGYSKKDTGDITVKAGETTTLLPLTLHAATGVVAGKVVDANGEPIAGVRLMLEGEETRFQDGVSGGDGRFRFERVAEGRNSLSAQRQSAGGPPQYVSKSLKNLAEGADVTLVMLPPPAETEGPAGAATAPAEDLEKRLRQAALGKPAPAWNPTGWVNAKGKIPATLAGLKGKVVVLDFWGIGCGPCVAMLPDVQKAHEQMSGKGVIIVGVHDSGTTPEQLAAFAAKKGLTYPMVIDAPAPAVQGAWFGKTFRAYGVVGIPQAALIDRSGKVVFIGEFSEALSRAGAMLTK